VAFGEGDHVVFQIGEIVRHGEWRLDEQYSTLLPEGLRVQTRDESVVMQFEMMAVAGSGGCGMLEPCVNAQAKPKTRLGRA